MSTVTGTVEGISHKWGKVSVLLNDGNWYGTKEEFYKEQGGPDLNKGDQISFQSGSTGKFLQNVKVVGAAAPAASSGSSTASRSGGGYSQVGVAVGAAMNQAISLEKPTSKALTPDDLDRIASNAQDLYEVAEGLKANTTAGDIRVDAAAKAKADSENADAMAALDREFA